VPGIHNVDENERSSVEAAPATASGWPLPDDYCEESHQRQVEAVLGPAGAALAKASHQAHALLREALGEGGFAVLDQYTSASLAMACAREEAVAAVCYSQGLGAGRVGPHAELGNAVVGALLASGVPTPTALQVAIEAVNAVSEALGVAG
jgi:hypothetical protein